ncbi:hypothetical protein K431DRAFT_137516 [Polychaeton citri CBS 116435]|uniref:Uncharacterized protein n=1 Tax=Polychaeton citri CBS 116435 TaxID=1314669 RepID=A0A9P4Q2L4_9PEZI|nr:hypothetical protein K431DRAFT_137516 [Polychaeton citri CBS 116435]
MQCCCADPALHTAGHNPANKTQSSRCVNLRPSTQVPASLPTRSTLQHCNPTHPRGPRHTRTHSHQCRTRSQRDGRGVRERARARARARGRGRGSERARERES